MALSDKIGLLERRIVQAGVIENLHTGGNATARITVTGATLVNVIVISGKISGQLNYESIVSIIGNDSVAFSMATYDFIKIECTNFASIQMPAHIIVNLSGFEHTFGAEINDSQISLNETWSSDKINALILTVGDVYVRSTRFETISSGTTGSVTIPSEQSVILDDFGGTIDAIVTTISNGRPTTSPAQTTGNTIIATTFDASGNYTFTGTPSTYPVAIMYRVRQKLSTYLDTNSNIVGFPQYESAIVAVSEVLDALAAELQWDRLYPSFYSEPTYDVNNRITQMQIWDSSLKVIPIFNKVYSYSGMQLTQVTITHVPNNSILTKTFFYNMAGFIQNVVRTYTP